jgi:hypothetical protein
MAETELRGGQAPKKVKKEQETAMAEHIEAAEWPSSYEGRRAGVDVHAGEEFWVTGRDCDYVDDTSEILSFLG